MSALGAQAPGQPATLSLACPSSPRASRRPSAWLALIRRPSAGLPPGRPATISRACQTVSGDHQPGDHQPGDHQPSHTQSKTAKSGTGRSLSGSPATSSTDVPREVFNGVTAVTRQNSSTLGMNCISTGPGTSPGTFNVLSDEPGLALIPPT